MSNYPTHRLCQTGDIPENAARGFDLDDGRSVAVFNIGGEFFAYRNICPHQYAAICHGRITGTMLPSDPGTFVYGLENSVVRCPWHNWEFNVRTGRSLFTNEPRRLAPVELRIEDGWIVVQVKPHSPTGTGSERALTS